MFHLVNVYFHVSYLYLRQELKFPSVPLHAIQLFCVRNTAVNTLNTWFNNSDPVFLDDVINDFRTMLQKNSYSDMFINHTIDYVLAKRAPLIQGGNANY